ncbi:MAG: hypothetical protein ACYC2P_04565 [Paludibacteraceae bacterium]
MKTSKAVLITIGIVFFYLVGINHSKYELFSASYIVIVFSTHITKFQKSFFTIIYFKRYGSGRLNGDRYTISKQTLKMNRANLSEYKPGFTGANN